MPRPTPAATRCALKALIDSAAGYKLDRREELEAIVAVGSSSFFALMKAYRVLPLRDDDHLKVGAIISQIGAGVLGAGAGRVGGVRPAVNQPFSGHHRTVRAFRVSTAGSAG
jgi:hypothetical protein